MAINIIAITILILAPIVGIAAYLFLHNIPINVAKERNHTQLDAIVALTHIGFIFLPALLAAYVWAYFDPQAPKTKEEVDVEEKA